MPETAAKISPTPTRVTSSVKAALPHSTPTKLSPAWPAVSQSAVPSVQHGQQSAGGQPLQPGIRSSLEGSFGVDLRTVRVHSDTRAQNTAHTLSARAFTFGNNIFLGPGERPNDLRLMAHETSHVIQQQAAPTIQRWSSQQGDRFEHEAQQASSAALLGESFTVKERTSNPRVQRLGLSDILDGLADLAANVPGFTLLTVIIGRNPINMRTVERNFTNILRGFMGLIPGGEILFQVLNRYGIVERLGNWVSEQVNALGITYDYLRRRFTAFTDSLSWTDIFSPGDVWRRARAIFSEPITRIRDFIVRLIAQAITWLKETFMQPLSEFCRQVPGYTLVTVLLGRDPFTNAPVARTALNVVRAFAEFIPGGTEKVNQLVESRALQRAYEWFIQETQARNLTWDRVTSTFAQAWNSLRLEDVLHPIETLQRMVNIFRPLMGDLVSFAGAALMKLLELIFEAVMGSGGARVLSILKRARATFLTIIQNPVGFLRNLLGAVGQGVRQFMTNILRHLQQGVIAWLTGPVARAGIQMPERWDLRGIIWFVLQILGLTWERVRQKLVRLVGERVMATLESAFQLIQDIRRVGLVQALRDRVTEFFGQLRDAALGSIRSFIQQRLVMAGITQLLSLLNPVGAVIQAIIKTYTTIQFFIQRINQILDLVESIVGSISAIASGAIGQAASFVERTMARTIPVILDFLARFIGLGDIGGQVQRTIQSLQARVDQMLDRAVDWIRRQTANLVSRALGGDPNAPPQQRLQQAVTEAKLVANRFAGRRVSALVLRPLLMAIKLRYRIQVLEVVAQGQRWTVRGQVNPILMETTDAIVLDSQAEAAQLFGQLATEAEQEFFPPLYGRLAREMQQGGSVQLQGRSSADIIQARRGLSQERAIIGQRPIREPIRERVGDINVSGMRAPTQSQPHNVYLNWLGRYGSTTSRDILPRINDLRALGLSDSNTSHILQSISTSGQPPTTQQLSERGYQGSADRAQRDIRFLVRLSRLVYQAEPLRFMDRGFSETAIGHTRQPVALTTVMGQQLVQSGALGPQGLDQVLGENAPLNPAAQSVLPNAPMETIARSNVRITGLVEQVRQRWSNWRLQSSQEIVARIRQQRPDVDPASLQLVPTKMRMLQMLEQFYGESFRIVIRR